MNRRIEMELKELRNVRHKHLNRLWKPNGAFIPARR